MALWTELTAEQQNTILHYVDTLVRPIMGELAVTLNHLEAANDDYLAQASAALALLDGIEEVPDNSGLAGTAILTKDEVVTLTSYIQGVLAYNTAGHRQNYVKAAGATNTIG